MLKFLRLTFAFFTGTVSGLIAFFVIIILVIAGLASSDTSTEIKDNSILVLKLNNEILDRGSSNPLSDFNPATMQTESKLGLNDIIKSIQAAKSDSKIKGIFLKPSFIRAGLSTTYEIREALKDFKTSGKFIISYSDLYSQKSYFLSTVSDKVYLQPEGLVEMRGLAAQMMFFKNALKKLGLEPEVIRHGKYKSAIEPFTEEKASDSNREQVQQMANSIWTSILTGIAEERGITVKKLNQLADSLTIDSDEAALKEGLVDGLKYYDEILAELKDSLSIDQSKDISSVSLSKYIETVKLDSQLDDAFNKDKIAVIYAGGNIVPGQGSDDNMGGDKIGRAIRKARRDSSIKAIVLRVNSGGGSALASEVMWREVKLAAETKPLVVSMGDAAASGGYYIACPANHIVANPTTITGSIGVFGLMFSGKEMLDNIGITTDVVKTNAHSDIGNFSRTLHAKEKEKLQKGVEEVYDNFISHVAEGRSQDKSYVDSIGQGRVWTGTDALEIGLIDELGGLSTAINSAKTRAGLSNFTIISLPEEKDPFEQIFGSLSGNVKMSIAEEVLGENFVYLKPLNEIKNIQDNIQARIPYELIIE